MSVNNLFEIHKNVAQEGKMFWKKRKAQVCGRRVWPGVDARSQTDAYLSHKLAELVGSHSCHL